MKTILLIEDDNNLSRGIAFSFQREGFIVHVAESLAAGRALFRRHQVDIVILDLNLPDGDGIDFCKEIREGSNTPVIMLTARDMETDELAGLSAGADDYITKPFSISILRARVESVLRRLDGSQREEICCGTFRLDTNQCKLYRHSEEIPISTTEYRLLKFLMSNAGNLLSKEQILTQLWSDQDEFIDDNTLSVNISRLRAKVEENPKKPRVIKTVYGMGYIWEVTP